MRNRSKYIPILSQLLILMFLMISCDDSTTDSRLHANVVQIGELRETVINNPGEYTDFRFDGLVKNIGDLIACNVNVLLVCYDFEGNFLDTLDCYGYYIEPDSIMEIGNLSPGEFAPFTYPFFRSPPFPYQSYEEVLICWED